MEVTPFRNTTKVFKCKRKSNEKSAGRNYQLKFIRTLAGISNRTPLTLSQKKLLPVVGCSGASEGNFGTISSHHGLGLSLKIPSGRNNIKVEAT
jgi:hypothetical protein